MIDRVIGYQRPPVPELVFRDENGAVIPYGRRWAAVDWDGPADTYSVTAHPERFTPFVAVARAIVEHLTATYDVSRTDTTYRDGATRIRLVPKLAGTAPLEFTFRSPSRVDVTAGGTQTMRGSALATTASFVGGSSAFRRSGPRGRPARRGC
jgi:uncharacterized protein DUF6226